MGIVEDIVTLSKTGKCFNHSDARSADKICEGSKAFLLENAKQFVFNHLHEPMLKCLGFDATPLTTTQMRQFSFNGKRLVRKSKQLGDFVCGRLFLQVPDGECCVVFTEPTRMADKTMIFVPTVALQPRLELLGFEHWGLDCVDTLLVGPPFDVECHCCGDGGDNKQPNIHMIVYLRFKGIWHPWHYQPPPFPPLIRGPMHPIPGQPNWTHPAQQPSQPHPAPSTPAPSTPAPASPIGPILVAHPAQLDHLCHDTHDAHVCNTRQHTQKVVHE